MMNSFKNEADQYIEEKMASSIEALMKSVVLGGIPDHFTFTKKAPKTDSSHKNQDAVLGEDKDVRHTSLLPLELSYLESVLENPHLPVTKIGELNGLSSYKNDKVKKKLIALGLLSELVINLGKKTGGIIKTLQLKTQGYMRLGKKPPYIKLPLGCSLEHFWWQQMIARFSQKEGFKSYIEMALANEKKVDVVIKKDGITTGVEVEISARNVIQNAKSDLASGELDRLIFACANHKIKQLVEKKLGESLNDKEQSRIQIMLLSEFHFVKDMMKKIKT